MFKVYIVNVKMFQFMNKNISFGLVFKIVCLLFQQKHVLWVLKTCALGAKKPVSLTVALFSTQDFTFIKTVLNVEGFLFFESGLIFKTVQKHVFLVLKRTVSRRRLF